MYKLYIPYNTIVATVLVFVVKSSFLFGAANKAPKTILLWGNGSWTSNDMKRGHQVFLSNACAQSNCYVTREKYLHGDYTKFDVIVFDMIASWNKLPEARSRYQKYVLTSQEPAAYYPIRLNTTHIDYFNLTWTYKLDSDIVFSYIIIRDARHEVIGPKIDMHWPKKDFKIKLDKELIKTLKTKSKAAAWVVSRCNAMSKREDFVKEVQRELRNYNLSVDIYGNCGPNVCLKHDTVKCLKQLGTTYYFYFSFENSLCDDYVTEKLLHALQNNMVPVVLGGANYTRFMPDGIYLNARELGTKKLASLIAASIKNPIMYYQFFWWKKFYSYHNALELGSHHSNCMLCSYINDDTVMNRVTVYHNMSAWWTPLVDRHGENYKV